MSNNKIKKPEEMSLFFDIRANGYDKHMKENIKFFDELYKLISKPITETKSEISILDLGCGTGLEVQSILDRCPNAFITGIDVSEKMLSELARKYEKYLNQIKLIKDSYLSIVLPENTYDYAVSVMTMHHLLYDIKQKTYEKIRKSLKIGGIYIEGDYIVSPEKEKQFLTEYHKIIRTSQTYENGKYHIDIPFSIETQTTILLEAGFSEVEIIWHKEEAAIIVAKKA